MEPVRSPSLVWLTQMGSRPIFSRLTNSPMAAQCSQIFGFGLSAGPENLPSVWTLYSPPYSRLPDEEGLLRESEQGRDLSL